MCIRDRITITTAILYKVFVNSLIVFKEIKIKKVFSIEEVMGASLMLALAVNCLGNFSIFGFSIRNILCILIVLVMGWKNGVLVGGTTAVSYTHLYSFLQSQ